MVGMTSPRGPLQWQGRGATALFARWLEISGVAPAYVGFRARARAAGNSPMTLTDKRHSAQFAQRYLEWRLSPPPKKQFPTGLFRSDDFAYGRRVHEVALNPGFCAQLLRGDFGTVSFAGPSTATRWPRRVIVMDCPNRSISLRYARHLALNSDALK